MLINSLQTLISEIAYICDRADPSLILREWTRPHQFQFNVVIPEDLSNPQHHSETAFFREPANVDQFVLLIFLVYNRFDRSEERIVWHYTDRTPHEGSG